jgi:prevent-host-death family protein
MAMSKKAMKPVGSADFKMRSLKLIDHVREARVEYVITRHGRPVAKLGPVDAPPPSPFVGSMRGSVLVYDDPFDPIPGAWSVND